MTQQSINELEIKLGSGCALIFLLLLLHSCWFPQVNIFFLFDFPISKSKMITQTLYNLQETCNLPYTLSTQDNVSAYGNCITWGPINPPLIGLKVCGKKQILVCSGRILQLEHTTTPRLQATALLPTTLIISVIGSILSLPLWDQIFLPAFFLKCLS